MSTSARIPFSVTFNLTDNSLVALVAAAGPMTFIVVEGMVVTNAHATVGTKVAIKDGAANRVQNYAAFGGGGWSTPEEGAILVCTENTALNAQCGTTGADVDISIWGYIDIRA